MNRTPSEAGRGGWLLPLLALVWLNLLLTLSVSPGPPWVSVVAAVSPDVLVLLILGVLLHRRLPTLPRWFRGVLASAVFVAASARIRGPDRPRAARPPARPGRGSSAPRQRGRDARARWRLPWAVGLAIPVAGLLLAALVAINWWAMAMLAAQVGRLTRRSRVGVALAAGSLVAASKPVAAGGIGGPVSPPDRLRSGHRPGSHLDRASAARGARPGRARLLCDLRGVLRGWRLSRIPSRGRASGKRPRAWAAEAEAAGFDFRSAQIQSPTFGGGSWRAHASLLSGLWVGPGGAL